MFVETGHFALILALVVAIAQAILPLLGAARRDPGLMGVGTSAALTQFELVALAMRLGMVVASGERRARISSRSTKTARRTAHGATSSRMTARNRVEIREIVPQLPFEA